MRHHSFFPLPHTAARRVTLQPRAIVGLIGISTLLAFGLSTPAAHAQSAQEQTLYGFSGIASDGANPQATLLDATTNGSELLYGTTKAGGTSHDGTIFSFNPVTQTVTTLFSFGSDSTIPQAGLINVNGIFYGTTLRGGTVDEGTVYSFDPITNAVHTLHSFSNTTTDGGIPAAGLTNVNGTLFGTTQFGGAHGSGTIFSINLTTNSETMLYSFNNAARDGTQPESALLNVNGILYGTTQFGGQKDAGTIFSIHPGGSNYKSVYSFQGVGGNDGSNPIAPLINVNGILYGTTNTGGTNGFGTVYSIDPVTNAKKTLYNFQGQSFNDASNPYGELIAIGNILFGTSSGGSTLGEGTAFSINLDGSNERVIYSFQGGSNDGANLFGGLINVKGTLFGAASKGGPNGNGTVFSMIPILPPTAKNDSGRTNFNTTLNIAAPGVLTNDSNGGDTTVTAALVTNPTHGTMTFHSDGSFVYTPNSGFLGTDSFTYQDINTAGKSNIATVSLTVQARVPLARNDNNIAKYETTLTIGAPGILNDDDNGGSSPLTASLVTGTSHGTVTLSSNGGYKYTPNAGFVGNDTFTYQAVNPIGKSNIATVTIIVQPTAPIAKNDSNVGKKNTTLTIGAPGVLNDDDTGGKGPLTAILVAGTSHGSVTLNSSGGYTYKPNIGFVGNDTFTYQAVNSLGKSNIATVTVIVQ